MKRGMYQGVLIEDKWIRRVHGEVFLNECFAVTHNKMHLVMDDPNVRQLLQSPNRKYRSALVQVCRKWCHNQTHIFSQKKGQKRVQWQVWSGG